MLKLKLYKQIHKIKEKWMQILLNDKSFGIHYIKLERNENIIEDKLILKIDKDSRDIISDEIEYEGCLSIYVKTKINLSICLYKTTFFTNYIFLNEEHNIDDEILIEAVMSNKESALKSNYNQLIVDVFYLWSQNIEIEWLKINSLEMKASYLGACYLWNSYDYVIENKGDINIQGELINCSEDLYYYLGESIMGKRGFFGSNLDSLDDFLIDLCKNNTIDNCIIFNNTETIINNTSKYFFETIVLLLGKSKFQVQIN
ncbi:MULTISPECIES: hypothetical protein [unclassified Chryseobacterium]|uniref:hypothetical protein n=1 Tax=unclassified Chryseobacterium TaxID=2593645 RepID=UPI002269CD77|nr:MULTISPECIES: hypothetical protein [unclassified Chryseobacterium]